jgi:hypothetical protein
VDPESQRRAFVECIGRFLPAKTVGIRADSYQLDDNFGQQSASLLQPGGPRQHSASSTIPGAWPSTAAETCTFRISTLTAASARSAPNGIISTVAGGGSTPPADGVFATAAQLRLPTGVAVDNSGNLYFTENVTGNDYRVFKVSGSGILTGCSPRE